MEELIKRLERVIATGASDEDGMHPISAEAVLEVVKELSEHGTNLASLGTDCISREQAIDVATSATMEWDGMYVQDLNVRIREAIEQLPPIQPVNTSENPNSSDVISREQAIDCFVINVGLHDEYGG